MHTFYLIFEYTNAAWARMLKNPDNREAGVRALVEALGGTVESLHWGADNTWAIVLARLPDSVTAAAVIAAASKTAAFKNVQTREVLTHDQLREMVARAEEVASLYRARRRGA